MTETISYVLRIELPKKEHAEYICNALVVDKELKSGQIRKQLRCEGNELVIELSCSEEHVKLLRTSASSIFDMVHLACRTINTFDA